MLIRGLTGIFTATGFVENEGRHPRMAHADFRRGPVDLVVNDRTGLVLAIGRNLSVDSAEEVLDGTDKVALPGFIDSHTHAVFAGSRTREFFRRWRGHSYRDIAAAGGGIASTQRATATTADGELTAGLARRLRHMLSLGTAVAEVKTGYGCTAGEELRLLTIIGRAAALVPTIRVIPTFLGLHAPPPGRVESEYCHELIGLLPKIRTQHLARYVDSFPESGFFSLNQSLRFSKAALTTGLGVKAHVDELTPGNAALPFIELGAQSIDHLQHVSPEAVDALAHSTTVATLLPATSFFLGLPYANARGLLDAGARVALATDFNPGTAPSASLIFTALLAASCLRMTAVEILCGLTYSAAGALGIENACGTLRPGAEARVFLARVDSISGTDPEEILERLLLSPVDARIDGDVVAVPLEPRLSAAAN